MAQGRAPQQPQAPQAPVPSPMKASPMAGLGSVEDRVAAYRGNPAPLQQRYAMSQDLLDLLALQKIKSEKDAAMRQMQMQMSQQQAAQGAEPMTVAQQREKEVMEMTKNELAQQRGETAQQQTQQQQQTMQKMMAGIAGAPGAQAAAQPRMMATGGIVAFAEGGTPPIDYDRPAYERRQAGPPRPSSAFQGPPKTAMLTPQQLNQLQSMGADDLAKQAAAQGGKISIKSLLQRFGAAGAASIIGEIGVAAFMRGLKFDRGQTQYGLGSELDPMVGAIAPDIPPQPRVPKLPKNRYFPEIDTYLSYPDQPTVSDDKSAEREVGAPPYADSDIAERADRMRSAAPPPPPAPPTTAAPPPPPAPPPAPRPPAPAPAAPAAPAAAGLAALTGPGTPADPLAQEVRSAAIAGMGRDPQQARLEEEQRQRQLLEFRDEQARRGKYADMLQRMYEEEFDPERQRQEGLKRFLIGAGGRRYGEFGAGAGAGITYDAAQRQQRMERLKGIEDVRQGIFGIQKGAVEKGIAGGEKAYTTTSDRARQAMASGSDLYKTESTALQSGLDRESRERVAKENNRIQSEIAQATRDQTLEVRRQGFLQDIARMESQALRDLQRGPDAKALADLRQLKAMNPKGFTKEQEAELANIQKRLDEAEDLIRTSMEVNRASLGGLGGRGRGTGAGLSDADRALIDKYTR